MKLFHWMAAITLATAAPAGAQTVYEYMQISAVESVVPMGLGRSRLITTDKDGQVIEKELLNFFSAVGINFGNIRNNDRVIADRLNDYAKEGWELISVNSGVYAADKSTGIFITRYVFRRPLR
ncbi:MAG: hypothetical protein RMM53_03765 [Bacteroidia bacterium]|nr:hypothetical protein [Bacteroidia bacterium]MDW8333313.1 hypothetical protein [Bacteroidia bacterium]